MHAPRLARMLPIFLLALGASLMQSGCAGKKTAAATDSAAELAGSGGETLPLVGNYKVTRFTLSNGLRLLVAEDHSSPTFAYQTWFRVGSRDELPGRTGLAHLFEHMMFKGPSPSKKASSTTCWRARESRVRTRLPTVTTLPI